MESKRLLIVVDSAAELNFHWKFALKDLVADIVRYLHPEGSTSQDPGAPRPSLGLFVFGSQGSCTESEVQPWGWTYNLNTFLRRLSAVSFTGSKSSEVALACGLSTALKIIAAAKHDNEAQAFGRTHCILVTSCNSQPNDQILDRDDVSLLKKDRFLVDATTVASRFVQSFVSLSVISPKQSPKLREIFMAGNVDQPMADSCSEDQEDFNYLILLSDNFKESHDALSYRDFLIEPVAENDNGKDSYPISSSKKKSSVNPRAWPKIPQGLQYTTNRLQLGGPARTHCWPAFHLGASNSREHVKRKKSAPLVDGGSSSNMIVSTSTDVRRFPSEQETEYVKAWEGDVTVMRNRETVVVDKLVVHRKISTSEALFSYWPERLHVEKLIPKTQVDEMNYLGKVEYIFVDAMHCTSQLDELAEKVLCAYIRLPRQTLLLHPAERSRFVGMLYAGVLNVPCRLG